MELSRGASASTRGSTSSNSGPKRTVTSTYRRVGAGSSVDESLFSSGGAKKTALTSRNLDAEKRELQGFSAPVPRTRKPARQAPEKQETVQLITKDMVRTLKVPRADPSGRSIVLLSSEFDRIKRNSRVITAEERQTAYEERKADEAAMQDASVARRKEMQAIEASRKVLAKPSDLEEEADERARTLLVKAESASQEQEDEIKKLNEVLLEAQCNTIRDFQLVERQSILQEVKEEDQRLDDMMEAERKKLIKENEHDERSRHLQRLEGAEVLRDQIARQEQIRILNDEKKDQETQQMRNYLQRLQEEDQATAHRKKEKQAEIMVDVAHANEEIKRLKSLKREQEKQEQLQVAKYLQEKAEREEALIKEAERQRIAKEKEIARLRSLQERAKDEQAEKDALRAKRDQEAAEREWRRKEKERVIKEQIMNEDLGEARVDQVRHKEHYLAVQAARDKDMFEGMVYDQKKAIEEDKQTEHKKATARFANAKGVRTQIEEKEDEKTKQRADFFQEGERLDQEAQERRARLHSIKMKKLDQLKEIGIPEKYCAQVSRHIHAPPPSFTMGGRP